MPSPMRRLAQTLEFSRLPFTVALAYLAFGETIDRVDLGRRASSSRPPSTSRGARHNSRHSGEAAQQQAAPPGTS